MPNYRYHFARFEGAIVRRAYRAWLPTIARRPIRSQREMPFRVYSYSGESMLPEQVASIRSFLRNAGRPKSFTVFSDGTYSDASIKLLKQIDSTVRVRAAPRPAAGCPPTLHFYLTKHPTGRQLSLIMSLSTTEGPVLYVDSDILFFPQAHELATLSKTQGMPALYLPDCQFSGDERLLREPSERDEPVNTGVLLLFQQLDWSLGLQRLVKLSGEPSFFTNQTVTHLTMHANGAKPFDRDKCILRLDDQFIYADRYANGSLVLRHYVNPVRHKFWTSLRRAK